MTDAGFPHSKAYLARQAERQRTLDGLRARLTWTDAQWLAERDADYVAQQRGYLGPRIATCEQDMKDDPDTEGYVAKYHTDEG